jgi:hypothetical protein
MTEVAGHTSPFVPLGGSGKREPVIQNPSQKAVGKYVRKLRKRGLTDEEIEHELHVDPESPIVQVVEAVRQNIFGKITPRTREELEAELISEEKGGFSQWVTVGDDEVCERCASREDQELPTIHWESIGKPPWAECTARHCRCRLISVRD